ncbi:MAG: fructose-bisphosphate aldolase class I [Candidatus Omnitrophica bacterium]|nr:fructose-bisphosphate aldolase class I [Candidatus Omnitrophota bacterium]
MSALGSQIVREIILPELEKEVNTGKNFALLRQIFNSQILATWYKKNLKEALLNQVYADKSTVKGVNLSDPSVKEQIYQQYLKAYKKGVFNYIKEEPGAAGQTIPRKYFSGGFDSALVVNVVKDDPTIAGRIHTTATFKVEAAVKTNGAPLVVTAPDVAMIAKAFNDEIPRLIEKFGKSFKKSPSRNEMMDVFGRAFYQWYINHGFQAPEEKFLRIVRSHTQGWGNKNELAIVVDHWLGRRTLRGDDVAIVLLDKEPQGKDWIWLPLNIYRVQNILTMMEYTLASEMFDSKTKSNDGLSEKDIVVIKAMASIFYGNEVGPFGPEVEAFIKRATLSPAIATGAQAIVQKVEGREINQEAYSIQFGGQKGVFNIISQDKSKVMEALSKSRGNVQTVLNEIWDNGQKTNLLVLVSKGIDPVFFKSDAAMMVQFDPQELKAAQETLVQFLSNPRIEVAHNPNRNTVVIVGLKDTREEQYLLKKLDDKFGLIVSKNDEGQKRLAHRNVSALEGYVKQTAKEAAQWLAAEGYLPDAAMAVENLKPEELNIIKAVAQFFYGKEIGSLGPKVEAILDTGDLRNISMDVGQIIGWLSDKDVEEQAYSLQPGGGTLNIFDKQKTEVIRLLRKVSGETRDLVAVLKRIWVDGKATNFALLMFHGKVADIIFRTRSTPTRSEVMFPPVKVAVTKEMRDDRAMVTKDKTWEDLTKLLQEKFKEILQRRGNTAHILGFLDSLTDEIVFGMGATTKTSEDSDLLSLLSAKEFTQGVLYKSTNRLPINFNSTGLPTGISRPISAGILSVNQKEYAVISGEDYFILLQPKYKDAAMTAKTDELSKIFQPLLESNDAGPYRSLYEAKNMDVTSFKAELSVFKNSSESSYFSFLESAMQKGLQSQEQLGWENLMAFIKTDPQYFFNEFVGPILKNDAAISFNRDSANRGRWLAYLGEAVRQTIKINTDAAMTADKAMIALGWKATAKQERIDRVIAILLMKGILSSKSNNWIVERFLLGKEFDIPNLDVQLMDQSNGQVKNLRDAHWILDAAWLTAKYDLDEQTFDMLSHNMFPLLSQNQTSFKHRGGEMVSLWNITKIVNDAEVLSNIRSNVKRIVEYATRAQTKLFTFEDREQRQTSEESILQFLRQEVHRLEYYTDAAMTAELRDNLRQTAAELVPPTKGILAADESIGSAKNRLDMVGRPNTYEDRQEMRRLMLTAPALKRAISGVILFEETFDNTDLQGNNLVQHYLLPNEILPGIKTDAGLMDNPDSPGEKIPNPKGLEKLPEMLQKFKAKGARFTKWRTTEVIDPVRGLPTEANIRKNAIVQARQAKLTQEAGLVPMVEPEVLLDGGHDIAASYKATTRTLEIIFEELTKAEVWLGGVVLKTSMILSGNKATNRADSETVGEQTLKGLLKTVPAEVPAIVFLSGGQKDDEVVQNLDAVIRASNSKFTAIRDAVVAELIAEGKAEQAAKVRALIKAPWEISYSFGRGLQRPALMAWAGKDENFASAQQVMTQTALTTQSARLGKLTDAAMTTMQLGSFTLGQIQSIGTQTHYVILSNVSQESMKIMDQSWGLSPIKGAKYVLIFYKEIPVAIGRLTEQDKSLKQAMQVVRLQDIISKKASKIQVGDQGVAPKTLIFNFVPYEGYVGKTEDELTLGFVTKFSREIKFNQIIPKGPFVFNVDSQDRLNYSVDLLERGNPDAAMVTTPAAKPSAAIIDQKRTSDSPTRSDAYILKLRFSSSNRILDDQGRDMIPLVKGNYSRFAAMKKLMDEMIQELNLRKLGLIETQRIPKAGEDFPAEYGILFEGIEGRKFSAIRQWLINKSLQLDAAMISGTFEGFRAEYGFVYTADGKRYTREEFRPVLEEMQKQAEKKEPSDYTGPPIAHGGWRYYILYHIPPEHMDMVKSLILKDKGMPGKFAVEIVNNNILVARDDPRRNQQLEAWFGQALERINEPVTTKMKRKLAEKSNDFLPRPTVPQESQRRRSDFAMKAQVPGGIDLNTQNMGLTIQKDANGGVQVTFDPAMIERIKAQGVQSMVPVIIDITPVSDIRPLLGLAPSREEELVGLLKT